VAPDGATHQPQTASVRGEDQGTIGSVIGRFCGMRIEEGAVSTITSTPNYYLARAHARPRAGVGTDNQESSYSATGKSQAHDASEVGVFDTWQRTACLNHEGHEAHSSRDRNGQEVRLGSLLETPNATRYSSRPGAGPVLATESHKCRGRCMTPWEFAGHVGELVGDLRTVDAEGQPNA